MASNYSDQVKDILLAAGCSFVRHGKGDHDIWHSPISGKHFPLDHDMKSRHTANAVLKQAGLPKAF